MPGNCFFVSLLWSLPWNKYCCFEKNSHMLFSHKLVILIVLFLVVFFSSSYLIVLLRLNKEIVRCYAWTRWSSWSKRNSKGRTISERTDPWTWKHWLTEGCYCLLWQGYSARTRPGKIINERQHNEKALN